MLISHADFEDQLLEVHQCLYSTDILLGDSNIQLEMLGGLWREAELKHSPTPAPLQRTSHFNQCL